MQETLHESIQPRKSYQDLTRQEIIDIIREAGVIGKGGAAYPLHAKLTIPEDKQVEYLILNGAECEAYLTSDDAAMKSNADEIIKGLEIVMYVLNVSHAIIGIEDNKPLAIERIAQASKRLSEDYRIDIYSLDTKYPHGYKKNIITSIAKFESPSGMRSIDTGCVVMNVSTAVALKRAVMDGMPLIEKIYTVSGRGIAQPKMIYAKIGTTVDHIIQQCGGVNENARKFVIDGPMMGISHFSTHIPVLKGNIGLLFLTDKEIDITTIRDCIRCGKCVDHCPVRLMPSMLSEFALYEEYEKAEKHQVMECIECGTCAYVCPAKRPLTSNIRMARQQIKTKKRARKTG
jgi:electron transport complex protein RnfC